MKPVFLRAGSDFEVFYPDLELRFRVNSVNETATGKLHGELLVTSDNAALVSTNDGEPPELAWDHLELGSLTSRARIAKALAACYKGTGPDFEVLLLEAMRGIAKRFRAAAPIETVEKAVRRTGDRYLLRPMLFDEETNGLYADGGSGKGWIALAVMLQLLTGKIPLGMGGKLVKRALYVDYETTREEIEDRVARLCEGMKLAPPPFDYHRATLSITQEVAAIRRSMLRWDFTVWDSMGAGMGEHPNDPGVGASAMNNLRQLESTLLFLDHTNKSGGMMASAYKRDLCRSLWTVAKRQGSDISEMHLTLWDKKVNNVAARHPQSLLFTFDGESGPVTVSPASVPVSEANGSQAGRKRQYATDAERKKEWRAKRKGLSVYTGDDDDSDDE